MAQAILGLLLALTSPFLLLPVERFLPYPHFIEEAVKLGIVAMILKAEREAKGSLWIWVVMAGFLFAMTESILYLMNIFALDNLMLFPKRLILTGGLHTGTMMLMYFLGRKNYMGFAAGFIGVVIIHYFFNLWVTRL